MKEYYIGLDVHKDSVFMAVLDDRKVRSNQKADSDVIETREIPANSPHLVKEIQRYQADGGTDSTSGATGGIPGAGTETAGIPGNRLPDG
jgi:hypothetical protein